MGVNIGWIFHEAFHELFKSYCPFITNVWVRHIGSDGYDGGGILAYTLVNSVFDNSYEYNYGQGND